MDLRLFNPVHERDNVPNRWLWLRRGRRNFDNPLFIVYYLMSTVQKHMYFSSTLEKTYCPRNCLTLALLGGHLPRQIPLLRHI